MVRRGVTSTPVAPPSDIQESATVFDQSTVTTADWHLAMAETASLSDTDSGNVPSADNWPTRILGSIMADRLNTALPLSTDGNHIGAYILQDGTQANVTLDSSLSHGSSNASQRIAVLNTGVASDGFIGFNFSSVRSFTDGEVVWDSFCFRAPSAWVFQPWPVTSPPGSVKLSIMSNHAASNQVNEVVEVIIDQMNVFGMYNQDGVSFPPYQPSLTSNCPVPGSSDFRYQDIDRGINPLTGNDPETGIPWSACAQDRARYGGLYGGKGSGQFQIGLGDPLGGGLHVPPDEWFCVTRRVARGVSATATTRYTLWVERETVPGYTKVLDATARTLGAGPVYDAVSLLPYVTQRVAGGTQVGSRTNNITGVRILSTGLGTPLGNGTLEYNSATGLFRWKGAGELFGTARGFSAANNILRINVSAGATSSLALEISPTSLPSGTVTDTVSISSGRPDTQVNYNDVIVSSFPIISPSGASPTGVSTLGDFAAAMTAGTWAQFTGATNQDAIVGSQHGSSGSLIYYTNKQPWNPISKRIDMVVQDETGGADGMHWVAYDDATHNWVQVQFPTIFSNIGHGLDHLQIDPFTGDRYYIPYNGGSTLPVFKCPFASTTWAQIPALSGLITNITVGSCWWRGTFTGGSGLGVRGGLVVFNAGNSTGVTTDGQIVVYDPVSNAWVYNATSMAPNYGAGPTYMEVMAYSRINNCAIYGGGNAAPFKAWRLNSNGTFTVMPAVPTPFGMSCTVGVVECDPITGNFLVLSGSELWELNPTGSGTWTKQTGSRVPPADINQVGVAQGGGGIVWTAIPEYGVLVITHQPTSVNGKMWVYKHA